MVAPRRGGARISSSCLSKAGSRRTARPRSLPRSNGSRAACAVADRALAALLPEIQPGLTEADIALRLEWRIRTGGAEALAFDVACLSGPEAALPHGAPGDRPILAGTVLLFDFGAQVAGYRSDMTRTLFVGEPSPADLDVYDLVARAQAAAIDVLEGAVARRRHVAIRALGRRGCARTSSRTPGTAPISATEPGTGSASPPMRRRLSDDRRPTILCRARPSSRSSRASTSMVRWAFGSRIWCCSMRPRVESNG